jgi:hypothetical protein
MNIHCSKAELAKIQALFKTRDENMAKAESYNAILDTKKPVSAEQGRLPIEEISPAPYLKDPYYLHVKPQELLRGRWRLFLSSYQPHEGFVYDELLIDKNSNYAETTRFGYFTEAFPFLALEENGKTWMSVTPHEINTMTPSLKEVHGKAITFGLGMGYYAYLAAEKENVSSITVIEKDPTVIALFKETLLPYFPKKEKVRIIEEDAFHYAKTMGKEHYDYAFVDLWHLPEDGLPLYVRMRQLEKKSPATQFVYWVEPSLLSLLRRAVLILLEEEIKGSTDEDYDYAATESDLLINELHRVLKKKTISSYGDVLALLEDASLREIALSLKL